MKTFWKELLIRITVCCFCIMSICNFGYFPVWLRGQDFGFDCSPVLPGGRGWSLFDPFLVIAYILRKSTQPNV